MVRILLERGAKKPGRTVAPVLETKSFDLIRHHVRHEQAVGFQISFGLDNCPGSGLVYRELSELDVPAGHLLLGQLKGRILPVASSKFGMQLSIGLRKP